MSFTTRGGRPVCSRALRYGAAASGLALAVCGLIALISVWTLATTGARIGSATERAEGEVIGAGDGRVQVRWEAPGGTRVDDVGLATSAPLVGTRTEVAFDPGNPTLMLIPGSKELAAVDHAASGAALSALLAAIVLATGGWILLTRSRLHHRTGQTVLVRRIRIQSGLLTRSWLETEADPQRWIPVHFDPVLVTLPAPTAIQLYGDPRAHRLVVAEIEGNWLYASGSVRATEPRGRRGDNPARPDGDARQHAAAAGWMRQLRADAVILIPAPFLGVLWTYLDGGGVLTFIGATVLAAVLGLWWAAIQGSDPTG